MKRHVGLVLVFALLTSVLGLLDQNKVGAVEDITNQILKDVEGNPLEKACDLANSENSAYCEQLRQGSGNGGSNCQQQAAINGTDVDCAAIDNPFVRLMQAALNIVVVIAASLAVIFIVVGAIRYSSSRGNPDGVAAAKKTVVYALIGLALTLSAGFIVSLILSAFD